MGRLILLMSFFLFANTLLAEALAPVDLKDQFETTTMVNEGTHWLIFSADKDVSDKVNKVLEELKITDIKSLNGAYVADISKMPEMITKMFALPKMKKYPFKVLLDQEGKATEKWPKEKSKATLMVLKNLEITSIQYSDSAEDIKKFIQTQTKK